MYAHAPHPTQCSEKHVPGFLAKMDQLKAHGVDTVALTAVNDAYVLAFWLQQLGATGKIVNRPLMV